MKLLEYREESISRGFILRCKAIYPYEEIVDFLVCEPINSDIQGYLLIVSSGYKAGLRFRQFPEESIPHGYRMGLDTNWLIENWSKWGYFDCKIEDVHILENLAPTIIDL